MTAADGVVDPLTVFDLEAVFDLGEDLVARTGEVDIGEPACIIANETKKPRSGAAMTMDHCTVHHRSRAVGPMRRRRVFRMKVVIATLYAAGCPDVSMARCRPGPAENKKAGRVPAARPASSPAALPTPSLAKRFPLSDELFLVLLRLGCRLATGRRHRRGDRDGRLEDFAVAAARLRRLE